jgi:hypothetical protein
MYRKKGNGFASGAAAEYAAHTPKKSQRQDRCGVPCRARGSPVSNLFDHTLVLEIGPLTARVGNSPALSERYVGENGTPAGEGAGPLLPFSLLVSEKICTQVGGRDMQCSFVPIERIMFAAAG